MIHFCQLQKFSADGQVYRAFRHLIAAQPGMILLAPLMAVVIENESILGAKAANAPDQEPGGLYPPGRLERRVRLNNWR